MANTTNEVQVSATAKYVRMAPRKVRMVVDQIRGKQVERALETLQFTNRAAAEPVAKTLQSAVANAENNNGPRAKGSASRINKRTSHITVIVAPRKEA